MQLQIPEDSFADWYVRHGRSFPWRDPSTTPFGILVAEILLRQTKAEMVAVVWPSLIRRYKNPVSLAASHRGKLRGTIKQLGLGRQRNRLSKNYLAHSSNAVTCRQS